MWRMRQLLGNRQTHVYQPTIYEDKDWYYRGRPNFLVLPPHLANSSFFPGGKFLNQLVPVTLLILLQWWEKEHLFTVYAQYMVFHVESRL